MWAILDVITSYSIHYTKLYEDAKRVDKDWQGQTVEMEGNVAFFDGTKETTLEYFESLLDHESIDTLFECEVDRVMQKDGVFYVVTPKGDFAAKHVRNNFV